MWTFGRRGAPSSEFRFASKAIAGRAVLLALLCLAWPLAALAVDTDGDGLEDADETGVHGTNPALYDTDADGVSDGDEVLHYPTDPLDDDSDDDGLLDGEERLSESGFGPERSIPAHPTSGVGLLAQIDGSGGLDVAYEVGQDGFGYRLNESAGGRPGFGPYQQVPDEQAYMTFVGSLAFWLDIDGDGDDDVFRNVIPEEPPPAFPGQALYFRENRLPSPSADFSEPVHLGIIAVNDAKVADLDGDGLRDLIVLSEWGGFEWYRRTSVAMPPEFTELGQRIASIPSTSIFTWTIDDVDGDGDVDITFSHDVAPAVFWVENRLDDEHHGDLAPAAPMVELEGIVTTHLIANLDDTPAAEIVVITLPPAELEERETTLRVFANPFEVRYRPNPRLPVSTGPVGWHESLSGNVDFLHAGDVDGDGDADLLISTNSHLAWIENRLGARIPAMGPMHTILDCCAYGAGGLTDLDRDGDLDVPVFPSWFENVFHLGSDPLAQDSDGDGLLDGDEIATYGTRPGRDDTDEDGLHDDEEITLAGTDPTNRDSDDDGLLDGEERAPMAFREGEAFSTSNQEIGSYSCCWLGNLRIGPIVELGRVDGDDDLDVLLGGDSNPAPWFDNRLRSPTRDLKGRIGASWLSEDGDPPTFAVAFDDDRIPVGALASSHYTTQISWHPAYFYPDGTFGYFHPTGVPVATDTVEVQRLHARDLDGDGDADVLAVDSGKGEVAWYANRLDEASADFGPARSIDAAIAGVEDVTPVDLDRDGDLDVLAGAHDAAEIRYYENRLDEPSADFAPAVVVSDTAVDVYRVDAFDFDGDGDLDPVATSINGSHVLWYENRLDEALPFASRVIADEPVGFQAVLAIDGGDLDRDGDEDVVFIEGAWLGNLVTVLSGGADTFVEPERTSVGIDHLGDVELGDLDGDGDLDALVTGVEQVAWLENLINFATAIDDPDTDDDGLLDGFEVEWGFAPLVATDTSPDPDLDGLDLLEEQAAGTSPFDDDTDGDGWDDDVELDRGGDPLDRNVLPVPEFGSPELVVLVMTVLELQRRRLRRTPLR